MWVSVIGDSDRSSPELRLTCEIEALPADPRLSDAGIGGDAVSLDGDEFDPFIRGRKRDDIDRKPFIFFVLWMRF